MAEADLQGVSEWRGLRRERGTGCQSVGCVLARVPGSAEHRSVTVRQLLGDARVQLATLEAESVQSCITSGACHAA